MVVIAAVVAVWKQGCDHHQTFKQVEHLSFLKHQDQRSPDTMLQLQPPSRNTHTKGRSAPHRSRESLGCCFCTSCERGSACSCRRRPCAGSRKSSLGAPRSFDPLPAVQARCALKSLATVSEAPDNDRSVHAALASQTGLEIAFGQDIKQDRFTFRRG